MVSMIMNDQSFHVLSRPGGLFPFEISLFRKREWGKKDKSNHAAQFTLFLFIELVSVLHSGVVLSVEATTDKSDTLISTS